jgi:hypothetical protein
MAASAIGTPGARFWRFKRSVTVPEETRQRIRHAALSLSPQLWIDGPDADIALDTLRSRIIQVSNKLGAASTSRTNPLLDWVTATKKIVGRVIGGADDFGDEEFAVLVDAFVATGEKRIESDYEYQALALDCMRLVSILFRVYARTMVGIRYAVVNDILGNGLAPSGTFTANERRPLIDRLFSDIGKPGIYELTDMMNDLISVCLSVQPGTEATALYDWIKVTHLQRLRELVASVIDEYPPPVLSDGRIIDPYGAWLGLGIRNATSSSSSAPGTRGHGSQRGS